jgi:hypothetical protein
MFPTAVAIQQVVVNGSPLQPGTDYVLLNKRRLVRMSGSSSQFPPAPAPNTPYYWPCCQDLRQQEDSEGCWYIDYFWGKPVPADGQIAALTLACEMAKAFSGNESSLPDRVTTIARQGITAIVMDPLTFVEKGLTGLPMVDLFVISANPFGLRRRSSITSPETIAPEETPPYSEMMFFPQPNL